MASNKPKLTGLTDISTNKLIGRGTAGTGSMEEITLGTNLSLTGTTLNATGGGSSPLTTKGDIYTYSTADARLPVGTDGQVLSADSTEATGLKWIAAGGGGSVTPSYQVVLTSSYTMTGSFVAIPFTTERIDNDSMHDNATNNTRITFTHAGTYLITASSNSDATNNADILRIRLNGSTVLAESGISSGSGIASTSLIRDFTAGDYVELLASDPYGGGGYTSNFIFSAASFGSIGNTTDISVQAKRTTTYTVTTTETAIAWDAENFDTDTMHDNVTNNSRITFTTAGKYQINANIVTQVAETMHLFQAYIKLNGSTILVQQGVASDTQNFIGASNGISLSYFGNFSTSDYVEVSVIYFTTAATIPVVQTTSTFSAYKVF